MFSRILKPDKDSFPQGAGDLLIETLRLQKIFKKRVVVSDLNLQVFRGDVFGFLGPNGAGKSTTIRMILGLIHASAGKIKLFDRPFPQQRKESLSKIGALVERPDFYLYLSAQQNLKLLGKMSGRIPDSRIQEMLEIVGLEDRARDRVKTFSHGMKQRLGIAQALLNNPELVILDEPSSGLDPEGMKEVRNLIQNISAQGMTVFLSSHLLHEVEQICNRMAIINRGELLVQGNVNELLKSGETILTIRTPQTRRAREILEKKKIAGSIEIQDERVRIKIDYSKIPQINAWLTDAGIPIFELTPQSSLEDFYLSIVRQADVDARKN
ncbi:putative ABC transporter ATP-binding protein YxlF [bacterium BMS3Abin05]|nr:putative ABC transporter ATP-binding protein YxlF [bacterium BMS3Abin05]GBE27483.1 putative ABC transporter ATP-binding protein YxlF [bacterium BMS3Bbin03]